MSDTKKPWPTTTLCDITPPVSLEANLRSILLPREGTYLPIAYMSVRVEQPAAFEFTWHAAGRPTMAHDKGCWSFSLPSIHAMSITLFCRPAGSYDILLDGEEEETCDN